MAEKILQETKRQYDLLNKKDLFNQQTKLLNSINKKLSRNIFNNFIPDYKNLATISLVFGDNKLSIQKKIILEQELISRMSKGEVEQKQKDLERIDKLTFKVLMKKFEEKYKGSLIKEQKELISNYIIGFRR